MYKGTGVFIPAYAAARMDASTNDCTDNATNSFRNHSQGPSKHSSTARRSRRMGPRRMGPRCLTGPFPPQLQQLSSPSSATCSESDLDILAAGSDASFTSTCNSLLAPGVPSPFATLADAPYGCDTMPWAGGLVADQQLLLHQAACQSVLSSEVADLVLLRQQEAELDAAINNLITLKQQLALLKQQPSSTPMGLDQLQALLSPAPSMPVSVATAALVPAASWPSSMAGGVNTIAVLDSSIAQAVQAVEEEMHQENLQAELLHMLSLA